MIKLFKYWLGLWKRVRKVKRCAREVESKGYDHMSAKFINTNYELSYMIAMYDYDEAIFELERYKEEHVS